MVFLKQPLWAIEELHIPLETCDVSQFAFAAFSGVAAGHKVNSSWGRVRVMRNKHGHERLKLTLSPQFHATDTVCHSMSIVIVSPSHRMIIYMSVSCRSFQLHLALATAADINKG